MKNPVYVVLSIMCFFWFHVSLHECSRSSRYAQDQASNWYQEYSRMKRIMYTICRLDVTDYSTQFSRESERQRENNNENILKTQKVLFRRLTMTFLLSRCS